jgi:endo-1,4-beta-mannosidase
MEQFRHSLTTRRTPIKYPSRIEEVKEKNKTQEIYFCRSTNKTEREIISYSNSIFPSFSLSQTVVRLFEHQVN